MAQTVPQTSSPDTLSEDFNHRSSNWVHRLHWGHVGLMVLGMTLPMVATAAPLGGATAMDIAVQFGHGVIEMASNAFEHTGPVLESVWNNMWEGNITPSTWDAGTMHSMTDHNMFGDTHLMPDGSIMDISATEALAAGIDPHLSAARDWYWGLDAQERIFMMEEAVETGMEFEDYLLSICPVDPISAIPQ